MQRAKGKGIDEKALDVKAEQALECWVQVQGVYPAAGFQRVNCPQRLVNDGGIR